jgi:hypothetical protein
VEHDATPPRGKFWVYERLIAAPYYAIFNVDAEELEVFALADGIYHRVAANERGRFPVPPLNVELGIWRGTYDRYTLPWLRAYRPDGTLVPTPQEAADQARERVTRLAAKLRELGIDPESV